MGGAKAGWLACALWIALAAPACSGPAEDDDLGVGGKLGGSGGSDAVGTGGEESASGGAPSEEDGSGGQALGSGGAMGPPLDECSPECGADTPHCIEGACVACLEGAGRCDGDTPAQCEDGEWVPGEPCSGATPACTNGVCGAAHLTGGLVSLRASSETGAMRLVEAHFELAPRVCAEVEEETWCLSGGLRP